MAAHGRAQQAQGTLRTCSIRRLRGLERRHAFCVWGAIHAPPPPRPLPARRHSVQRLGRPRAQVTDTLCSEDTQLLLAQDAALLERQSKVSAERTFNTWTGPLVGSLVSAASTTLLVVMTVDPEASEANPRVVGALAGITEAAFGATTVALSLRIKNRLKLKREYWRLDSQRAQLAIQLRQMPGSDCADPLTSSVGRARHAARLHVLEQQRDQLSYAGPAVLLAASSVAVAGFSLSAGFRWLFLNSFSDYPEEEYRSQEKVQVWALAGAALVSIGALAGSVYWFRARRSERARTTPELKSLRERDKELRLAVAPQVGTKTLGFVLQGSF